MRRVYCLEVGFACVAFVLVYLWWRHRGLQPLDPSADLATYRAALLLPQE